MISSGFLERGERMRREDLLIVNISLKLIIIKL